MATKSEMDITALKGHEEIPEPILPKFNKESRRIIEQHFHVVKRFVCPMCGHVCASEEIQDRCPACNYPEPSFRAYKLHKKGLGEIILNPFTDKIEKEKENG